VAIAKEKKGLFTRKRPPIINKVVRKTKI